jgi:hypothetical protein
MSNISKERTKPDWTEQERSGWDGTEAERKEKEKGSSVFSDMEIQSKPPFSASAEVDALAIRFQQIEPFDQITHHDISTVIGEDCTLPRGRNIIYRARKRAQNEAGIVFRSISGIGYQRVDDSGKLEIAKDGVRAINRKVRKTEGVLDTVEIEKLEQVNRESYFLNKTLIGLLKQGSSSKFGRALQNRLKDSSANLGDTNLLKLFGKSAKKSEE